MSPQEDTTEEIWRERARLLFSHQPFVLGGNIVTAASVFIMLWGREPQTALVTWTLAVWLLSAIRWLGVNARFKLQPKNFDGFRWVRIFTLFSGLSGVVWGSTGIFLFQQDPLVLGVLFIVYAGMAAGSVSSHSTYLPSYVAYVVPTITPFALHCISLLDLFYVMLGSLCLVYMLVNIYYGRNIQRSQTESIRLRFENLELIGDLIAEKGVAEQAHREADHANAAKTQFLAAASHDLRQPTQAMELFVDALAHDVQDPTLKPLIDNIRATGHSLRNMLDELLDFARIDAAAIKPALADFPVGNMIERIAGEFSAQASQRGLRLRVVSTRAWVRSDAALLERILRNLLANAIKYTAKGKVLIGCRRIRNNLSIEVHDTGPGIPPHLQNEIFKEFYQIANPERDRRKGLGLGLSIVDGLTHLLGHSLALQSTVGRGSCFAVTVPTAPPKEVLASEPSLSEDILAGHTILLVEDDPTICEAANQLLSRWGCTTIVAPTPAEVQSALDGRTPDAILADYRLANGQTGLDAIFVVRDLCGLSLPAAIITGDVAPECQNEAEASGVSLLHKPLSGAKLRALLTSLLV